MPGGNFCYRVALISAVCSRQRGDDSFLGAVFGILVGFSDLFCCRQDSTEDINAYQDNDRFCDDELSYEEMAEIEDFDLF